MNKHCDSVPIEQAYELKERLGIRTKQEFAKLCGVDRKQFQNWEKKGRMPQYRLSHLKEALSLLAKSQYDDQMSRIYGK